LILGVVVGQFSMPIYTQRRAPPICETVRDLDQLYSDLGMADETPGDVMHSVCNPTLPDAGKVWDGVVEKSGE